MERCFRPTFDIIHLCESLQNVTSWLSASGSYLFLQGLPEFDLWGKMYKYTLDSSSVKQT